MTLNLIEQDKAQRQLALDVSQSFIVQAPAGSGKTELLIQRFLSLLCHVKKPEEILAITFTKKAASEMHARVIHALKQAQVAEEPESAHAKQTWYLAKQVMQQDQQYQWHLIENPNQLRIQTIDSLCTHLTRQLPLLSHFGSQPDIADSPKDFYSEAVQEVLSHLEENVDWSDAIAKLLLHLDNDLNKLHDLLVHLLEKRDQWLPYLHLDINDISIKDLLEKNLQTVISESLNDLINIFPMELADELLQLMKYAVDNLRISQPDSIHVAAWDIDPMPSHHPSDKAAWNGIASFLLTQEGTFRKQVNATMGFPAPSNAKNSIEKALFSENKERMLALLSQFHEYDELCDVLNELKYLPEPHYQPHQWEFLQALLVVLKVAAAQLRVVFQQYGQIDFIENAQAAITALGDDAHPTDLALALDYQIKHLLVDEFQDTSINQYTLLEKLTAGWEQNDGRTLFVVGDPMQSIYRFRQAEVGLFIRMSLHGIGHIALRPISLSVNFRSSSAIVDWNNEQFQSLFPAESNMTTGAVSFSPSIANQKQTNECIQPAVAVEGFLDGDAHTQANKIISVIQQCQTTQSNDRIAILVRTRNHLKNIIDALKKSNIPYRAVDIDKLDSRQCIQDLLSLTNALLHPADRIAWLALLRAPWCGLTLADLLIISGDNAYTSIFDQLKQNDLIQSLSEDGKKRISSILPIIQAKMADRHRHTLRYWIESTWVLLGGPASLSEPSEIQDAAMFFQLLDEFDQRGESLNFEKLKTSVKELYAAPMQDEKALQLMTIHSAKGLEFDTVILPHLERSTKKDDKQLFLWMERPQLNNQIALLLAPIHATGFENDAIYKYIEHQHHLKSNYETDRLLYVATTRAKKNLYLFFNTKKNQNGKYSIESDSLLKKLWPQFEKNAHTIISSKPVVAMTPDTELKHHRAIKRFTLDWMNPVKDVAVTQITSHQTQRGFLLSDITARLIGTVSHRVLQTISEKGVSWWQEQNEADKLQYIKHGLIQEGLIRNELDHSTKTIYAIIQKACTDEKGQWILHSHREAKSEFAITAHLNGKIENLIIDRTFIDETGCRWIIDYKTSGMMETDIDKEQEKYRSQLQKYQQAMQLMDARPIRVGLYFPAIPAWREI